MSNTSINILQPTEENIILIEKIRTRSYGIEKDNIEENYYTQQIRNGNYLVFVTLLDNKIVSGCYLSNAYNSLSVEQLFVRPEYQEKGLHLGKNLLKYILDNKYIIEEYFQQKFTTSTISPISEKSKKIYESLGYTTTNKIFNIMGKKL